MRYSVKQVSVTGKRVKGAWYYSQVTLKEIEQTFANKNAATAKINRMGWKAEKVIDTETERNTVRWEVVGR